MPTYVACDGGLRGGDQTFVPRYVNGVRYYATAEERLIQADGDGSLEGLHIGPPDDEHDAESPIANFVLEPDTGRDDALDEYLGVSGEALYRVDAEIPLCAGDGGEACAEGVHHCTGLFGTRAWEDGRLQQGLVILRAPQMRSRRDAMEAALVAQEFERWDENKRKVFMGRLPEEKRTYLLDRYPNIMEWYATNAGPAEDAVDWDAVDERNRSVLKALDEGTETYFHQSGECVLIGDGHADAALRHLGNLRYSSGTVQIRKAKGLSKGKLYVTGAPDQDAFARAVERISDKRVSFEDQEEDDDAE
jgi:hypothetical protein